MIAELEDWYSKGYRLGTCNLDCLTFCEVNDWDDLRVVEITGHTCCYNDNFLIDCTNGCIWEYTNLTKTIVHALLGKKPTDVTSFFDKESYRIFWDYSYKKEVLWDGVSDYNVDVQLIFKRLRRLRVVDIGKFSDFMR